MTATFRCTHLSGRGAAGRVPALAQFVADDFQRDLAFLSIVPSPAFVRAPEGNGCAERFIRTLKENLLWLRRLDPGEELHGLPFRLMTPCAPAVGAPGLDGPVLPSDRRKSEGSDPAFH